MRLASRLAYKGDVVKLIRRVSLGLREGNSDKVYIVDLCEVSNKKFVVNFQFGRRGQPLKDGTKTDNPVAEPVARSIFAKLVDEKTRKGYRETTLAAAAAAASPATPAPPPARRRGNLSREEAVLARLRGENSNFRRAWSLERVAWRAGEMRLKAAVPLLLDKLGSGSELLDYCLAWALARCGDETTFAAACTARRKPGLKPADAVASVSQIVPKASKSDTVERMALEMLRAWSEDLKAAVAARALQALPAGLRHVAEVGPAEAFTEALQRTLAAGESTLVLDHLYRIDSPVVRPGLLAALRTVPFTPGPFRSVRHIYKLAEVRGDVEVFGLLAHRVEKTPHNFAARRGTYVDGRWTDVTKELKKADSRLAYGERTRNYLRNRSWLSLQRVGSLGDAGSYVRAAVGVLLPFTDADGQEPRNMSRYDYSSRKTKTTHWDRFAPYLAFNHILHGNGGRYELKGRTRTWRCTGKYKPGDPAPDQREEMFPALWDQVPVGLLHLLAESQCAPVHVFATRALRANKEFCDELDVETIAMLLGRPYEVTARLGYDLAVARYDANNPDFDLVAALANAPVDEARAMARRCIDANRTLFAGARDLMASLILSRWADTRAYARTLLASVTLPPGVPESLIARVIATMLEFPVDDQHEYRARDGGEILLRAFARQLRSLGVNILRDLARHPLAGVQMFAAEVLLAHDIRPEKLPEDLIAALAVESKHANVRSLGIRLFGELPESALMQRVNLLLAFATSSLADQRAAIRPILQRLAASQPTFGHQIVPPLLAVLVSKEEHEGIHGFVLSLLKTDLGAALGSVSKDAVLRLLRSKYPQAQELGGILLGRNVDPNSLEVGEVAKLASHEILSVREAAWKFFRENKPRVVAELGVAIKILDASWGDSRQFAFDLFRTFSEHEFTPDVLVAVCDSVRPDVQAFGRELVTRFFQEAHGHEYLLRLSEHPSADVQLFATNYLERFAAGSLERINLLEPYFLGVLSRVNRGRVAKARVFAFLREESSKSPEAAQLVARLMTRQSLTMAIGDKAASIENMVDVRHKFPDIPMPVTIKQPAVWTKREVRRGV